MMTRISSLCSVLLVLSVAACQGGSDKLPNIAFTSVPESQIGAPNSKVVLSAMAESDSGQPVNYVWRKLVGDDFIEVGTGPTLEVTLGTPQQPCSQYVDGYQVVASSSIASVTHSFSVTSDDAVNCMGGLFGALAGSSASALKASPGNEIWRRPGEMITLNVSIQDPAFTSVAWYQVLGDGSARKVADGTSFQVAAPALSKNCEQIELFYEARAQSALGSTSEVIIVEVLAPFCTFTKSDGLAANATTKVIVTDDDRVVVGTESGLSIFDDEVWSLPYTSAGNKRPLLTINALAEDPDGTLWVGNTFYAIGFGLDGRGVERLDKAGLWNNTLLSSDIDHSIEGKLAREIVFEPSGNSFSALLMTSTDLRSSGGLTRGNRDFSASTVLVGRQSIYATTVDTFGYRWYGTGPSGSLDASSGILVFKNNSKVASFDGSEWGGVGATRLTDNRDIRAMVTDASGDIWIGLRASTLQKGGLVRFTPDPVLALRGTFSSSPIGLPKSNDIRALALDAQDNLWIATDAGIVVRLRDGGRFERVTKEQGLPSNDVRDLVYDSNERIMWAATASGLVRVAIPFFSGIVDYGE